MKTALVIIGLIICLGTVDNLLINFAALGLVALGMEV